MSSRLDRELAAAAGDAPLGDAVAPPVAVPVARPRRPKSLGLLATLLVMVGALVALFLVGFKDAAVYSMPVDKLITESAANVGRRVRVEGELVPGTLQKRDKPCEYRFQVHGDSGKPLPIRYAQCVIPDTFRDVPAGGVQVTVEGALGKDGGFEASLVMAKCASKYDPNTHTMKPGT